MGPRNKLSTWRNGRLVAIKECPSGAFNNQRQTIIWKYTGSSPSSTVENTCQVCEHVWIESIQINID